ncbi:hypothetical protein [Nocardioides sp. GXQ0305]|uniref:hypothetical protein n=1 Tax=Nocardioides sp. GXQ0305 TaxID=3423912 RepID=UPI003D7E9699
MAALALALLPQAAQASVSESTDSTPRVNGPVYAIAQVGDLTIIGGQFTTVGGKPRLNAAAIRADGTLDPNFVPDPDGIVRAVAGSPDGSTVYLGGRFDSAGGAARANIAAVSATSGAVLPDWQADTTGGSPGIHALAQAGDRLYVGGSFSGIDGTVRASMVALDTAGNVVSGFRSRANGLVRAIRVSPDTTKVYAGGAFSKLGGADRPYGIGEILATNGDATGFSPSTGGALAITLGLSPDGSRLYFSTPDNMLYAYDVASNAPAWSRKSAGDVQAIAPSATELYVGGHFSQFTIGSAKVKRHFLASLNPGDGTMTSWDPDPQGGDNGVWAITLTPTALLAGGTFTTVDGVERVRFARFPGTP